MTDKNQTNNNQSNESEKQIWGWYAHRDENRDANTSPAVEEWLDHVESNDELIQQMANESRVSAMLELESQTPEQNETFVQSLRQRIVTNRNNVAQSPNIELREPTQRSTNLPPNRHAAGRRRLARIATLLAASLACAAAFFTWQAFQDDPQPVVDHSTEQIIDPSPEDENRAPTVSPAPLEDAIANSPSSAQPADQSPATELIVNSPPTKPPTEQVKSLPPKPLVDVPKMAQRDIQPLPDDRDAPPNLNQQTFAELVTKTKSSPTNNSVTTRIGATQNTQITEGRGMVKFDNGIKLYLESPGEGRVVSEHQIEWWQGKILVDIPSSAGQVTIVTPNHTWTSNRANYQIHLADDDSLEAYVTSGRVTVEETNAEESAAKIVLSSKELNQIVLQPSTELAIPSITIAKGRTRFLGQIGLQRNTFESDSPVLFSQVANNVRENREQLAEPDFAKRWSSFVKKSRRVRKPNTAPIGIPFENQADPKQNKNANGIPGDGSNSGSSSFEGVLNIDGQLRRFDSFEEFQKAREQMMGKPGFENIPNQPFANPPGNPNAAFQGEININGKSLKFNSPDVFKRFQREIKR